MELPKKLRSKVLLWMIVVAVIVGFVAGIMGELFARSFVLGYLTSNAEIVEVNNLFYELLAKYNFLSNEEKDGRLEIVIRKPEINGGLAIVQEVTAGDFIENLQNSTVTFFNAKKIVSQDLLISSYQNQDALGRGFILTNDGWLVTTDQVLTSQSASYVAVTSKGEVFEIRKVVIDPLSEAVFAKIETSNVSILGMADKNDVLSGQSAVALDQDGGVKISSVQNHNYRAVARIQDRVISSDTLDSYYLPADDFNNIALGEPVVDGQGKVIGLVVNYNRQKVVMPMTNFISEVDEVLRDSEIQRVNLGIDYLDLRQLTIDPQVDTSYRGLNRGVLIYKNVSWGVAGISRKSPAEQAGLEVGQVVLKVEGEEINSRVKLNQLIQEYDAGQEIELTIWDAGEEKIVNVTLTELE